MPQWMWLFQHGSKASLEALLRQNLTDLQHNLPQEWCDWILAISFGTRIVRKQAVYSVNPGCTANCSQAYPLRARLQGENNDRKLAVYIQLQRMFLGIGFWYSFCSLVRFHAVASSDSTEKLGPKVYHLTTICVLNQSSLKVHLVYCSSPNSDPEDFRRSLRLVCTAQWVSRAC